MSNRNANRIDRRRFGHQAIGAAMAGTTLSRVPEASDLLFADEPSFSLDYILGSPMYGTAPLAEVIGEAKKIGAHGVDLWPRPHANHREQMDELGFDQLQRLLDDHRVKLGVLTRYDLGPYGLAEEMKVLQRFGGKLIISGAKQQAADTLKARVAKFVESMKPHVAAAEEHGITIGIENHVGNLLSSPDSIKYFADFATSPHLGLAMAPYHLPQVAETIAALVRHLGNQNLVFFQAWQYGKGCAQKLPKAEEMLQMPGLGPLDFRPILTALREISFGGWTEIFMHPVPRGIPIRPTSAAVSAEINRARDYLRRCM